MRATQLAQKGRDSPTPEQMMSSSNIFDNCTSMVRSKKKKILNRSEWRLFSPTLGWVQLLPLDVSIQSSDGNNVCLIIFNS